MDLLQGCINNTAAVNLQLNAVTALSMLARDGGQALETLLQPDGELAISCKSLLFSRHQAPYLFY